MQWGLFALIVTATALRGGVVWVDGRIRELKNYRIRKTSYQYTKYILGAKRSAEIRAKLAQLADERMGGNDRNS